VLNVAPRSMIVLAVVCLPRDPATWPAELEAWARRSGLDGYRAYHVEDDASVELFIDARSEEDADRFAAACRISPPDVRGPMVVVGRFRRAEMASGA
jgi:hypothetical protein